MNLLNSIAQYFTPSSPITQSIPASSHQELENSVREQFNELINESNIRSDLQFRISENPTFCAARGVNFGKLGNPHILLTPELNEVDRDAFSFLVKRELSHIKNNDLFTIPTIEIVTSLGLSFFIEEKSFKNLLVTHLIETVAPPEVSLALNFFIKEKSSKPFLVNRLVNYLAKIPTIFLSRCSERKADAYAISHSSREELEAARRFFEAAKMTLHPSWINLRQPSLDQRIHQIEHALEKIGHPVREEWRVREVDLKAINLIKLMYYHKVAHYK